MSTALSTTPRCALLIVAAGAGTRLGAGRPKARVELSDGRTILEHCLQGGLQAYRGDSGGAGRLAGAVVVVPGSPEAAQPLVQLCEQIAERTGHRVLTVPGGAERSDSVRAGLAACAALGEQSDRPVTHVLVHDAARPFVPPAVFQRVVDALEAGAAAVVPAVPVTDTVKTVAPWTGAGPVPLRVVDTPARAALRAVQTPQGFVLDQLAEAHRRAQEAGGDAAALTDDSMLMEAAGHTVAVVDGDVESFKITTALDLQLADALLQTRSASDDSPPCPQAAATERTLA